MAAGGSFQRQATVRNRVNQRNFRARRQAYIQELELRLQRLANDGVRATKEVQIAAQRVDNENRLLRLLLRTQFGVSDCQLNEYLAGHICASDVCTYGFRRNADRDHASKRLKESVSTQIIPARREQPVSAKASQESVRMGEEPPQVLVATSQYPEGEWTSIVIPASGTDSPQSLQLDSPADLLYTGIPIGLGEPSPLELEEYERDYGRDPTYSYHAPSNKKTAPGSSPSAKRADAHAGETSCVEAAKIIATLRGCNVDEDMWSELGCRAKQSCRVQNISVFELMDKA
ncbi:hypothetical protein LTR99_011005 [Exophiala xenobiotica]|uniref:BZIP domain-containing protein n=1 Tax=Vermiconidia calcicola TaxID=1690605 RepID=A0AAV9PQJ4_9PEZI|nr:hypothetical protein LTR99_011005 [Exophiala xenobiotica]KAK5425579.1 hypothetical protein LTR34_010965 [Exophiala xenobiotica]KAK5527709.1 hypothetical protein LTR25_010952 [Vermiconidia calcicola]KAK5530193.1 hypothetical protein LTR23_010480 [Chaetothyriales sp. CCFEE 6169]